MIWNEAIKNPPKLSGYYLCKYRAEKKYAVFWYENKKWYRKKSGTYSYSKHGVKSVSWWVDIENVQVIDKSNKFFKKIEGRVRYTCLNCGHSVLKTQFRLCPMCGIDLLWMSSL